MTFHETCIEDQFVAGTVSCGDNINHNTLFRCPGTLLYDIEKALVISGEVDRDFLKGHILAPWNGYVEEVTKRNDFACHWRPNSARRLA